MARRPPEHDSAGRDPAKARFYFIAFHRLFGAVLAMLGLLVIEDRIDWPTKLGYGLLVIGLFDVFVAPILLARLWRTPRP